MRRHHDSRVIDKRAINGRLLFEHIERGAGYLARLDRRQQGGLIDDSAPCAIDQPQALPGLPQHLAAYQRAGTICLGHMNG